MSKVQFWAIMWVLCNIVSNGEKTATMEGQWGFAGIACSMFMASAIVREMRKKEKE